MPATRRSCPRWFRPGYSLLARGHVVRRRSLFSPRHSWWLTSAPRLQDNCGLAFSEGFPSGQRDQTVNLTAQPSEVQILPPPPNEMNSHPVNADGQGVRGRALPARCGGAALSLRFAEAGEAYVWFGVSGSRFTGGCSSMVEPQPSKLMMWVRSPSPAPENFAHIAQSVEHFLGKEEVTGSNPVMGSSI